MKFYIKFASVYNSDIPEKHKYLFQKEECLEQQDWDISAIEKQDAYTISQLKKYSFENGIDKEIYTVKPLFKGESEYKYIKWWYPSFRYFIELSSFEDLIKLSKTLGYKIIIDVGIKIDSNSPDLMGGGFNLGKPFINKEETPVLVVYDNYIE